MGRHRTVSAKELKNKQQQMTPASEKMFVCIECGEYVTYVVRRNKNHVSYFIHTNLVDDSTVCSLRENSNDISKTIYETSGLPLYLKKGDLNRFELFIGFYSLENVSLDRAEADSSKVKISSNKDCREGTEYLINSYNFFEAETTLKKLDTYSKRYYLSYYPEIWKKMFASRWGENIEGFTKGGALFAYGENGGRKIRINDEITTDKDYFLVSPESVILNIPNSLESEKCGELMLKLDCKRKMFIIYKIRFKSDNEQQFKMLYYFFRDNFKVSLIYKPLNLIPIWPPTVTIDDETKYFEDVKETSLLLETEEKKVDIYIHNSDNASVKKGTEINSNLLMFTLPISSNRIALTIIERYNSINLLLNQFRERIPIVTQYIDIKSEVGIDLEIGEHATLPNRNKAIINSVNRCNILQVRNKKVYKQFQIKNRNGVIVEDIKFGDQIFAEIGIKRVMLLNFIEIEQIVSNNIDAQKLYLQLKKNGKPYISSPIWIRKLLDKTSNDPKLRELIKKYVFLNQIPVRSHDILKSVYKSIGKEDKS